MSRSLPVAQTESDPKVPGPTTWPLCPSLWAFFFLPWRSHHTMAVDS